MAQKENLAAFLAGLDPKTGNPKGDSLSTASDAQIAKTLTEVRQMQQAGEPFQFSLSGATPAQDKAAMAALAAGYSPSDIAKDVFPRQSPAASAASGKNQAQAAYEAQVKQVENSPWTKLGDALAGQMQQEMVPLQQLTSGAAIPQYQNQAEQGALNLLGIPSNSPSASWLSAATANARAATTPVSAAMQNVSNAYQSAGSAFTSALMNSAQSNALAVETAPESAWLNALASHVTSNLSYYGEIPTADIGVLQSAPGVVSALQQSGGYAGGASGAGLTPLQDLSVKNGQVTVNKNASALTGSPGAGGTIPAPTSNAG